MEGTPSVVVPWDAAMGAVCPRWRGVGQEENPGVPTGKELGQGLVVAPLGPAG